MRFHVIVVDDEELAVEGLKVFPWESYGFELTASFTDSRTALDWCKSNPVDVVVADVRMPGMTGLELAAVLKESLPDVLVILFSGHNEFAYAQEALRQQVFRYVLKPVDDEELGVALQDASAYLVERERKKHWTQQIARDYWFRENLLDRRVETDAEELADLDPASLGGSGYTIFVVATERDLLAMMRPVSGVLQCTTLRAGEWAVLLDTANRNSFRDWLEKHRLVSGASSGHTGLRELRQGFLEARKAAEMRFLWPERCVVLYEDIPLANDEAISDDMVHASELSGGLVLQEPEACATRLAELLEAMIHHGAGPAEIRRAAFILAVGVQAAIRESGRTLPGDALLQLPDLFAIVDTASAVDELTRQFCSGIAVIHEALEREQVRQRADEQLLRALDYIHAHYWEPISLDDVAEYLHMHPSRFSVWFKKAKGVNYIDYLTRYRTEVAKQLLRSADTRVRDVAEQVGFQDPRYFGQVFKKLVGITPGRYQLHHGRHDPADATNEEHIS